MLRVALIYAWQLKNGLNSCLSLATFLPTFLYLACSHWSVSYSGTERESERESMPVIPCWCDTAWQQMSLCLLAGKLDQTAWWRVKKSFRCPYRGLWKIKRSILLTPLPEQFLYPSPFGWETGTNNANSGLSECERTVDQTHGLTPFKSPIRSFLGNVAKSQRIRFTRCLELP